MSETTFDPGATLSYQPTRNVIEPILFVQLLLGLSGIGLIAWGLLDSVFWDREGYLKGSICLAIAIGIALLVSGAALDSQWKKFALWFSVCLVGQATTLQLLDVGRNVHYQHITHFGEISPVMVVLILIQFVLVLVGLRFHWNVIRTWVGARFNAWQLAVITVLFYAFTAAPARELGFYTYELILAGLLVTVNAGSVVMAVWSLPNGMMPRATMYLASVFGEDAVKRRGETVNRDRVPVYIALWVAALASLLSVVVYQGHPHIQDEVAYLFQARYFASGLLALPVPPLPDAFNIYLMFLDGDKWYSIFPPGWPAVLAVGVLLGLPWLINPILAGVNVVLIYKLTRALYDRPTARLVGFLVGASPWFIFMSMNYMSHTLLLSGVLATLLSVDKTRTTGKVRWAWVAGLALGLTALVRPLDAVIVALLAGLWAIGVGGRRLPFHSIAVFVLTTAVVGSGILWYNQQLTGNPLTFPLTIYYDATYGPGTNAFGFGPDRGLGWALDPFPGHGILDAVINAVLNLFSVNIELNGWSTGSLLLVALAIVLPKRRSDNLVFALIGSVILAYSFYWFSGGPDFGARYWYVAIVPFSILAARGVQGLAQKLEKGEWYATEGGLRVVTGVAILVLTSLLNYMPWRAIDKYYHYLGMRPDITKLARENGFGTSLVLIRGDEHPDYTSAFVYNPLDLRSEDTVYARYGTRADNVELLNEYKGRSVWVVDGPSVTGSGFKVSEGPLSIEQFIEKQ